MAAIYVYVQDRMFGPYSPVDVRSWYQYGALPPSSQVWDWDVNAWVPIASFLGLEPSLPPQSHVATPPVHAAAQTAERGPFSNDRLPWVLVGIGLVLLGVILIPMQVASMRRDADTLPDQSAYQIMTGCMNEAITRSGGDHATALSQTQPLIDCAGAQLGTSGNWTCEADGCWHGGQGFGWIRILAAIENPAGQLPQGQSGEDDFVRYCQQELGLDADQCRASWESVP